MFTVEVRLPVAGTVEPTAAYGSARRPDREPHPAGYAVGVVLAESQPRRAGGEQPAEPDQDEVRCDLIRGGSGYPAAGGIRKAGSPSAGRRAAFWLFRCPYSLLKSITPPAMTMIRPATTATVGWLALEGKITCVPPIKMSSRHGTSHGRPRRKVTVHHRCSTIACCQGSHVLVRLAGSQALPAELRGARPMTSATSTASQVNGPTSQSRRADGAKSPDVARIVGSRVATAAPYRRFSQTLPQLRIPDRAVS